MRPETALATIAAKVTTAAILPGGCWYPSQPQPAPRSGQVVWRGHERPDVDPDGQTWLLRPVVFLIGPALNESTYDVASIDPLVRAMADVFDPSNPSAFFLEITGDRVDHCRNTGGGPEPFFGFYAYRFDLEIKLHRHAGDN